MNRKIFPAIQQFNEHTNYIVNCAFLHVLVLFSQLEKLSGWITWTWFFIQNFSTENVASFSWDEELQAIDTEMPKTARVFKSMITKTHKQLEMKLGYLMKDYVSFGFDFEHN